MKKLAFLVLLLISTNCFASDYHQNGQRHTIVYTITTVSGDPVDGQSPTCAVKRMSDGDYYDWNDGTFKVAASATTPFKIMTFDKTGGFYYRTLSIDNSVLVSDDYTVIVSNDDTAYADVQSENIVFDTVSNLIKINR